MALLGFAFLIVCGLYFIFVGGMCIWAYLGLSGQFSWTGLTAAFVGAALITIALINAPFTISMQAAQ